MMEILGHQVVLQRLQDALEKKNKTCHTKKADVNAA